MEHTWAQLALGTKPRGAPPGLMKLQLFCRCVSLLSHDTEIFVICYTAKTDGVQSLA